MTSRPIVLGLHGDNYGYAKAVYGGGLPDHVKVRRLRSVSLGHLPGAPESLRWVRLFSPLPHTDLVHSYNHLVLNRRPWVASFESWFPRFHTDRHNDRLWEWGFRRIESALCRHLLPLSEAAANLFLDQAGRFGVDLDQLRSKLQVVYPAIPIPDASSGFDPKTEVNRRTRILFISHTFFLKGGRALLRAVKELRRSYDIELTVVGRVRLDRVTGATEDDIRAAIRELTETPGIIWEPSIQHQTLMTHYYRSADIYCLPTFGDSFGFTNIEAMSQALPVVATRYFAIPEQVIHGNTGFLVDLPVDKLGRLDYVLGLGVSDRATRREFVRELENSVTSQLVRYLARLVEDSELRLEFGRAGRRRFQEIFSVEARNTKLAALWSTAAS